MLIKSGRMAKQRFVPKSSPPLKFEPPVKSSPLLKLLKSRAVVPENKLYLSYSKSQYDLSQLFDDPIKEFKINKKYKFNGKNNLVGRVLEAKVIRLRFSSHLEDYLRNLYYTRRSSNKISLY
jgi:hypothetical protein